MERSSTSPVIAKRAAPPTKAVATAARWSPPDVRGPRPAALLTLPTVPCELDEGVPPRELEHTKREHTCALCKIMHVQRKHGSYARGAWGVEPLLTVPKGVTEMQRHEYRALIFAVTAG